MTQESPKRRPLPPSPFRWMWAKRARLFAAARLLAYCFVVFSVLGVLALRSAYGDMKESALVIGRQLSQFGDLTGHTHRLMLNGEPINLASAMTDQSVKRVLDRFQAACKRGEVGLAKDFQHLPEALRKKALAKAGESEVGIMRKENDGEGMVACLVRGKDQANTPIAKRLKEFAKTGDLSSVGFLRYAYARRTPAGHTHVITSWTDGSFHIFNMAPMDGSEPPGTDPPHAGRPHGAKRLLSASIEGTPHSVRVYDCPSQPEAALSGFDAQVSKKGWKAIPFVASESPGARAYSRKGADMLVFAAPEGDRSVVSIVESRSE